MIAPPLSIDEPFRLQALRRTHLLDTPLEERFERLTRLAQRILQMPIAALSLVDADRQWFKSIQGFKIAETSREISFCGHAILRDDVMVVPDARADVRFSDNPLVAGEPHVVFYAGCPVRASDGSRIGSLCVIDQKPRTMSHEDLQALRDLAAIAENELSESMQRSVQQELMAQLDMVSRQAQVDSLTRVWNREAIFELLDTELARARRAGTGVGILMADIDFFKRINDTLGHAAGDVVLSQTARRILGTIREVDVLGRYGGEEFLVVLGPCNGEVGTKIVAERICDRIGASPLVTEFGPIQVSVSVGAAYCETATAVTGEMLVQAADEAMYRAKRAGRSRVECAVVNGGERSSLKTASLKLAAS
ncbi:MAG TPA: sensor domain-containing diguanylate cyclase [Tepidisphaeraceae bacterium]|nr:sensor domain-containing diguanylate cyclase [Tepidisphaeraceae bacterium]